MVVLDALLRRFAPRPVKVANSNNLCFPMPKKGAQIGGAAYAKANAAERDAFAGCNTAGFTQPCRRHKVRKTCCASDNNCRTS